MQIDKLRCSQIPFLLFKPSVDSRSFGKVVSRYMNGHSEEAIEIDAHKPADILNYLNIKELKTPFYIVIDEAQFFDKSLVELVIYLNSLGISFIISGLDLDAKCKPFGPMGDLLSISTKVLKMNAVCEQCYSVATRTSLKNNDPDFAKNNIKIGDGDIYEVLCLKCYYAKFKMENDE